VQRERTSAAVASVSNHPVAIRAARAAATIAALVFLALVLAFWAWRWFGPVAAPVPPSTPIPDTQWVSRINNSHLFGQSESAQKNTAPLAAPTDAHLLGTFSEPGGRGYALFRLPSGSRLIAVGQSLPDGSVLEAVRPDGIVLTQGTTRRDLPLRAGTSAFATAPIRVAAAGSTGTVPAAGTVVKTAANCSPPTGFTGQVIRLNAELVGGMQSTPGTWKAMLQSSNGALLVRDQSGFAGMLGLQNGDRIDQANGVVLRLPEDVAESVLRPLTRSLPVTLVGRRDGQVRQWLYLNAGSCPV